MTYRGNNISILPTRGINNSRNPILIGDDQSPDCQNVRFRLLSVDKRDGVKKFNGADITAVPAVQGIAELMKDNGNNSQVVVAGGKIWLNGGSSWSNITGALTISNSADKLYQFCQLTDLLIGTNGNDALWKYNGAGNAVALGGTPPATAAAICQYKNYVVLGDVAGVGGRVQWSDLNAPETWPAPNVNNIINAGGQRVLGFGQLVDTNYVFMTRSIQQMSYTGDAVSPFNFPTRVGLGTGCVSGLSIVPTSNALFYASEQGFFQFDGNESAYISGDIEGTWRTVNKNRYKFIVGIKNERYSEIWWFIPTGSNTQNDTILVYNYADKVWYPFSGPLVNCVGKFYSQSPTDPILGTYTGNVWQANAGTKNDDGSAIDAYVTTKPNGMGDPSRLRQVDEYRVIATTDPTAGAVILTYHAYNLNVLTQGTSIPFAATGSGVWDSGAWDSMTWAGAQGQRLDLVVRPTGHGRMFQVKLRNNQLDVDMSIGALLLAYRQRKGEGQ